MCCASSGAGAVCSLTTAMRSPREIAAAPRARAGRLVLRSDPERASGQCLDLLFIFPGKFLMRLARGLARRNFGPASLHLLPVKQIIEVQEALSGWLKRRDGEGSLNRQ